MDIVAAALQVLRVFREFRDPKAFKVYRDLQDSKVLVAMQEPKERRAFKGLQDFRDRRAFKVFRVKSVEGETPALQDRRVTLDTRAPRVPLQTRVPQEQQGR